MSKKFKILFIYEWLVKAGAQKYLFELVRSINKDKFEVSVLCGINSSNKNAVPKEYYFFELENLGINIYPLLGLDISTELPLIKKGYNKFLNLLEKLFLISLKKFKVKKIRINNDNRIKELVIEQNRVVVIDFYSYDRIADFINEIPKIEVHILCDTFQYNYDIFKNFNKEKCYDFFYYNPALLIDLKKSFKTCCTFKHLPLILNLESIPHLNIKPPDTSNIVSVGVFTRISQSKRLEFFILAFQLLRLKNQKINYHLKIIGFIHSEQYYENIKGMINFYHLTPFVTFLGHSDNLNNTIIDENIAFGWHIHTTSSPGYAGIEIAATGLPSIYYEAGNINYDDDIKIKRFNMIDKFVEETNYLACNHELYMNYSKLQRKYMLDTFNINNYIKNLENHWLS